MSHNPSYVAGGTILPSTFVQAQGTTNNSSVITAASASRPVGVAYEGSRDAPIPGVTPQAALAGESIKVYGPGDVCEVVVGAVDLAAGVLVMPDAGGLGKAILATSGSYYGGVTIDSALASTRVKIQVQIGQLN